MSVTTNPHRAIRFSRRADAEMFAAGDEDAWRVVQHGFDVGEGHCSCARDAQECHVHGGERLPSPQSATQEKL